MIPHAPDPLQAPAPTTTRASSTLPAHIQTLLATALPCPRCGVIDRPALGPGAGMHYARLRCQHCQCFLRWVSQYADAERLARRQQGQRHAMATKPPTAPQLAYLRGLGDTGPPPANRQEASERIDAWLKKGQAS
jgi:hypothetical protein